MQAEPIQAKQPRPAWLKPFARMGYGARGLIYLVVAVFTIMTAVSGGENQDTRDAIRLIWENPAGGIMALVLVVSLASYSLWQFVQAVFDTDDHGIALPGGAVRIGLLGSCITYGLLAAYTFSLWRGGGGASPGDGGFAAMFAQAIGARYAALAVASVFAVVGLAHIWKAVAGKYREHFRAPEDAMRFIGPVAVVGLIARGIIFLLLGLLFYRRGLTAGDDGGQPGLKEALDYIVSLPAGNWLLGLTGVGLIAFAGYSFTEAWWRRINVDDA